MLFSVHQIRVHMQEPLTIQCPYCFEVVVIVMAIDDIGEMITDCEVCCRPWALSVWLDDEGRLQARARRL